MVDHRFPHATRATFGRRQAPCASIRQAPAPSSLSDDLRLFALTFAGGFLFMTIYLA